MIHSKLSRLSYYIFFGLLLSNSVILFFLIRGIIRYYPNDYDTEFWIMAIFMFSFVIYCVFHINSIILLRIKNNTLRFLSVTKPLGKTLHFKDFKGIYKTTETGSGGTYEVVYLVDHNDITRFKIMGLYYKNMDEIIAAIPLPVIKRNLSPKEYLKLMFTGRANLSKIKDKKNTESKMAFYFKVFSVVTILIFVIGMLIRMFSR